jgi:hypothetical protein
VSKYHRSRSGRGVTILPPPAYTSASHWATFLSLPALLLPPTHLASSTPVTPQILGYKNFFALYSKFRGYSLLSLLFFSPF